MNNGLRVPCTYQGGKQRISKKIVDIFFEANSIDNQTLFFDLCCGSGAISIELVNRGISPNNIIMLDISSWGAFWNAIGKGSFNMDVFNSFLLGLPDDKRLYKEYLTKLVENSNSTFEAELYTILQSNSFGGKQISFKDGCWKNACFRKYWEPTENSVRRSPANPMQPSPAELKRRVELIQEKMFGVTCLQKDIMDFFTYDIPENAVVYVDPPYRNTTGYSYFFNIEDFINQYLCTFRAPLYISENIALSQKAVRLHLSGANGGITGSRKKKHEEWLSSF